MTPSRTDSLRDYVRDLYASDTIEEAFDLPPRPQDPPPRALARLGAEHSAKGMRGLHKLLTEDEEPDPEELDCMEAIVLLTGRPALDIQDGVYEEPPPDWQRLDDPATRARLQAVIPFVGRVELPEHPWIPYGGTAFVVAPDLVMTNAHVARLFTAGRSPMPLTIIDAQEVGVDFLCERDRDLRQYLLVREVLMVHPVWDMALLRVEGLDLTRRLPELWAVEPLDLREHDIAVLGYPARDPRNALVHQDRIFDGVYNVKRLQPGKLKGRRPYKRLKPLIHDSSTLGGNSGSAIVDVAHGRIVGLHFAGIYKKRNYGVPIRELARDPLVREHLRFLDAEGLSEDPAVQRAWSKPVQEVTASARPVASSSQQVRPQLVLDGGSVELTIPLHLRISLGAPVVGTPSPDLSEDEVEEAVSYRIQRREPYSDRQGYDPDFLGVEVKLPWISDAQFADVAFNDQATHHAHMLPYHRFTVCMCRSRRLAYYTAINIDGRQKKTIRRSTFSDRWFRDPRIGDDEQWNNDLYYDNPYDRGHLVRRLDATWGPSFAAASLAHDDTFHYTNCSPQHRDFNRQEHPWAELENYVLYSAFNHQLKINVFTGPILRDTDPVYLTRKGDHRVQIPVEYWKVVTFTREDGTLSASAYVVPQRDLVSQVPGMEEFAYGAFQMRQVSIPELEERTGYVFRGLSAVDTFGEEEAVGGRVIESVQDILL